MEVEVISTFKPDFPSTRGERDPFGSYQAVWLASSPQAASCRWMDRQPQPHRRAAEPTVTLQTSQQFKDPSTAPLHGVLPPSSFDPKPCVLLEFLGLAYSGRSGADLGSKATWEGNPLSPRMRTGVERSLDGCTVSRHVTSGSHTSKRHECSAC